MLEIKDLNVRYGGIHAVRGIDMSVPQGNIVTLIGANGAGKSSTLRAICNLVKKTGTISFMGEDISKLPTREIVKRGISMVPEGRRVFADLTIYENLVLGAYTRKDEAGIKSDIEWVYSLFPRLKEREKQLAGTLSGGEQQMLAVGRALMSRPKLLMMDEPSLGLAPILVRDVFKIIQKIHEEGVTILLIEQNARMALKVADYAYVLETGAIALSGSGQELLKNQEVTRAYLGGV
ncbi:MAG: branched-chain amino acid transport system ATP-binding protein [Thermoanaerobacteraceae bacterium]|jgi:branched-chain amino acid transport system ATP-binding protein|uniref:ATP-binding cassette domain-containing protein n=1 Tax=Biomaibacter acetigenes TaxID=2316383 RepID=A0A3G2R7F2_9FIRM|nr:ABC transporter ATP-binding protein [Biomaibacter acetigenes]MDK2879184.1 branched-chain amino acid transport system ATP-binding protein [Thermoanaerobacteraceae bacterium]RKL61413.1 ABC transporter ATP-binding protein [Thermoanaerobacteraceae bacterium SP2]AYO31305.1 ATP-binding cassette domain-containing protein [Biomaibacter acetigenes]MDN5300998.1 branched-chain amino acid transport system ATP-binding protein [Thermoanaerobacteraceae bacterium]MDN5311260.1 branched-chain amino acid tran